MAPSSAKPNGRRRWGLSALHRKLHRASTSDEITQSGRTAQNPTAHLNVDVDTRPPSRASKLSAKTNTTVDVAQHVETVEIVLHENNAGSSLEQGPNDSAEAVRTAAAQPAAGSSGTGPTHGDSAGTASVSSDIWSAAYREALETLEKDIKVPILEGVNVERLFQQLEEIDNEANQESAFLRGVRCLRKIKGPLENFKLALDFAAPLSTIDPTASVVFGMVRNVTADIPKIAISFATADTDFAKQIGDMLEQLSYIDDCDTLGRKMDKTGIHKALVSVYKKLLEFYGAAYEMLQRRGTKLALTMVLEANRLPTIVQEFLKEAATLHTLIQTATSEIITEIKGMLYEQQISGWLGGKRLDQQSEYHHRLKQLRTDDACKYLLQHTNFMKWYGAPNSQQLAISGDMGSGKTVAMAFLIDELNRRNETQLPRPKVCYYYCRDNETGEAAHILAGLILSLLKQLSGLNKTFYEWHQRKQEDAGVVGPATSTRELEEFLYLVVPTLDRLLFIVVDGLDECDGESRSSLLRLLTSLSAKTPRLKIILSSRPDHDILEQLDQALPIEMEANADRDAIIVRKTVQSSLSRLPEDVREIVTKMLSRSAHGSAIWTKMIVELIKVRKISAYAPMERFLREMPLPDKLSTLYTTLITKSASDDTENMVLIIAALKLLAAASRPLSIEELAWAAALAADQSGLESVAQLSESVDPGRLISLILPFITRVDNNDIKKRQVQLVHQSVKEFVLKEAPRLQGDNARLGSGSIHSQQEKEDLDAFMLNTCIDYLLLQEIGSNNLFSDVQLGFQELPQITNLDSDEEAPEYNPKVSWEVWEEGMSRYDPIDRGFGGFFVYASSQWPKHFGAVSDNALPDPAKIETLCEAKSTRLKNWIGQTVRPNCTVQARFDFPSELYDPLSITALYGTEAMLQHMLQNSEFGSDKYLPSTAMCAADHVLQWGDVSKLDVTIAATGNLSKLKILATEGKLAPKLRNLEFFKLIIKRWYELEPRHNDWSVAFGLAEHVTSLMIEEKWGRELINVALHAVCLPIIRCLQSLAQHNQDLMAELRFGDFDIAENLLEGQFTFKGKPLDRLQFSKELTLIKDAWRLRDSLSTEERETREIP